MVLPEMIEWTKHGTHVTILHPTVWREFMSNKYFNQMRHEGIAYSKKNGNNMLYSPGQSLAFRYWAIAERIHSTEIVVDALPIKDYMPDFLRTYKNAGINEIVLYGDAKSQVQLLSSFNCIELGECCVFRQETDLFTGKLERIKGLKIVLAHPN